MSNESSGKPGETFKQKIVLLLLTGALTGVLVPVISSILAEQRSRRERSEAATLAKQASAEAESRARHASVIHAQEVFLIQLEKTIFDFHTRAAAVPWYRSQQPDLIRYQAARDAYEGASWAF